MAKKSTIQMFFFTTLTATLAILLSEAYGQSVYINPVETVSTCSSGLRAGVDFYIVRGTVNATTGKLSYFIDVQIKRTSSNGFKLLCTVGLFSCVIPNPQSCYCAVQHSNLYEIVVNRSISLSDSESLVRVQWSNSSGTSVVSNEQQLPRVYDSDAVKTNLILNGTPMTCPATVKQGSVIKFQCQDSPSPCYLALAIDNIDQVIGENNVAYTVNGSLASYSQYNFTFTYSVCRGNLKSFMCLVTTVTSSPSRPSGSPNKAINTGSDIRVFIIVFSFSYMLIFYVITHAVR